MSKNKQKHSRPEEFHRGQVKHLKKLIKQKDQEIRRLEKELGYNQNNSPKTKRVKESESDTCNNCGKGILQTVDYGVRKITICSLCEFRKVSK